ncbi:uncharacterized protein LOC143914125 [Arctopsyche grandis]|uniref:uncharacterized protein LOC143914125 n=1 Tax=Arctopsyche grandis TaxID=121162 RepID=UPI00406D8C50
MDHRGKRDLTTFNKYKKVLPPNRLEPTNLKFLCYFQNVRGLNSKTEVLFNSATTQCPDVIALAETWLSESVLDGELFDRRYIYRRDRGTRGGGVLLALRIQVNTIQNDYNGAILDLIYANTSSNITVTRSIDPLITEDIYHPSIELSIEFSVSGKFHDSHSLRGDGQMMLGWIFKPKDDFTKLSNILLFSDWSVLYNCKDINHAVNTFYKTVYETCDLLFNRKVLIPNSNANYPKWFSNELIGNYITACEHTLSPDPSAFWSLIKSKRSLNQIRSYKYKNADVIGLQNIADAFADYFGNTQAPTKNATNMTYNPSDEIDWSPTFHLDQCTIEDLNFAFIKIKPKFSADKWKISKVIPVYKKGDRQLIDSHRPIAVLSAPAKLLEIIIHRYLYRHCDPFIIDQQHGFRQSRSTVTNLLCLSNYITKSLDVGGQVDVAIQISKKPLTLKQNVSYYGRISNEYPTLSGVPQGSNLADLQSDLDAIFNWSTKNLLPFNIEKCCFINFTRSRNRFSYSYHLNGIGKDYSTNRSSEPYYARCTRQGVKPTFI